MVDSNGGWPENRKLILKTLERHEEKIDQILSKVSRMQADQLVLKSKVAIYGGIVGTVCGTIAGAVAAYLT